ncbi:MAG: antitoxin Xre/MbcA/ParS toxin-binding domain-containing protein [Thermoanaerobaculia bacterium]
MASAVANRISKIREKAGIKGREIAQLLDTTQETVSRWNTGKVDPQPEHLHRLLTLEWLVEELGEFYEPDEARLWLFAPNRLLGGESPAQRIQGGKLDDVLAVIHQLRDGAYA